MGHKRSLAKCLKAKLASLVAQVDQLEEQVDNFNIEVIALETERAKLCDSVAKDPESRTESGWEDYGGQDQAERDSTDWYSKEEQEKPYKFKPQGRPRSTGEHANYADDDLEESMEQAFQEWKKRKMAAQNSSTSEDEFMGNTQGSNTSSE